MQIERERYYDEAQEVRQREGGAAGKEAEAGRPGSSRSSARLQGRKAVAGAVECAGRAFRTRVDDDSERLAVEGGKKACEGLGAGRVGKARGCREWIAG